MTTLFVLGSVVIACSVKVEHLPRLGESLAAETFTMEVGGKGFNFALGAARLGARVGGVLPLGNDPFGQLAERTIHNAGLPPHMIVRVEAQTGSGIGFADHDGDNCLAVYPGANGRLSAAELRASAAEIAEAGAVLAQFEIPDEPILEAFTLARRCGRPTVLTPSPFRPVDRRILALTSILVVNRVEADDLARQFGTGPTNHGVDLSLTAVAEVAAALHPSGPETIIVTLGNQGALALRAGQSAIHQPAFAVNAVDTLGAGDAFVTGFAVTLVEGRTFEECLRCAAACAAITVQRVGVFSALPTRKEVDAFLTNGPALRL